MSRRKPPAINDEMRRLQKVVAVLIAIQVAAEEDTEFNVADALAVVIALANETLAGLDRIEVTRGRE